MFLSSATQFHAYPNLNSTRLLSEIQLCYYDCTALFPEKYVTILNSDKTPVINGKRNTSDSLWGINISSSQTASFRTTHMNTNEKSGLHLDKTKYELASYLHAAAGCLIKSTFI